MVDPGNLVGGNDQTLLTTIVSMDPMYVYFDVAERDLLRYLRWKQEQDVERTGAQKEVLMRLEDETEFVHKGHLDFLDNRVDPATGTALIRGVFPNKGDVFRDGMNAWVRIPTDPIPNAVLVDDRAIGTDLGGKYVLVLAANNVVELRHVELGTLIDGNRIVRSGITAEQQYITVGLQRARPGLPVEPETAANEPPAEAVCRLPTDWFTQRGAAPASAEIARLTVPVCPAVKLNQSWSPSRSMVPESDKLSSIVPRP